MTFKVQPYLTGALIFAMFFSPPEGKMKTVAWGILALFACFGYWKAGGVEIKK